MKDKGFTIAMIGVLITMGICVAIIWDDLLFWLLVAVIVLIFLIA